MDNCKIYYLTLIPYQGYGGKNQISGFWRPSWEALVIVSTFPFLVSFFFWDETLRFLLLSLDKVELT